MENVQISIFCQTYNHVKYIQDAIEGILNQITEFTYRIFIYDDVSSDGTSEIIGRYKNKHPDIIEIFRPDRNRYEEERQKGFPEREKIRKKYLTGKYIALCEGDDCWVDPYKLQTQVEFMEKHLECVMTVHDAWQLDCRTGEKRKHSNFNATGYLTPEDIILKGAGGIPTASFVLSREAFFWDESFPKCEVGDWPRQLFAITKGKIYYFNEKMSLYRYMHNGSWSAKYGDDKIYSICHRLRMIEFLTKYDDYTSRKFHLSIRKRENIYFFDNISEYMEIDDVQLYVKKCNELSRLTERKYDTLMEDMKRIWGLLNEVSYNDKEIEKYAKKYKYLVIIGMGKYSDVIRRYLEKCGIEYIGCILSNDQKVLEDENVWKIEDFPYRWEETGIIVALHPKWQEDAEKSLLAERVYSYYAPFWIEDNIYYKDSTKIHI